MSNATSPPSNLTLEGCSKCYLTLSKIQSSFQALGWSKLRPKSILAMFLWQNAVYCLKSQFKTKELGWHRKRSNWYSPRSKIKSDIRSSLKWAWDFRSANRFANDSVATSKCSQPRNLEANLYLQCKFLTVTILRKSVYLRKISMFRYIVAILATKSMEQSNKQ